jgi:uncharacterized protein
MSSNLELLKEYVINTVANDYENFEMLSQQIRQWPAEYQASYSSAALVEALNQAIREGEVVSHLYDATLGRMKPESLDVGRIDEYWFLASEKAKRALKESSRK